MWAMALAGVSTYMAMSSAKSEGIHKYNKSQFEANQLALQASQDMIISEQEQNDRMASFSSQQETNIAMRAFMGRDVDDASFQAFLDKQKKIAYADTSRMNQQGFIQLGQSKMAIKQAKYTGNVAIQTAKAKSNAALVSGMYGMYKAG
tara:strand:- start:3654 stop:4097 length:444 start_codon:yes stop_codon:yes gene_type:complete